MKFLPYEDVPLYLSVDGHNGEHIFAESASLSVNQPLSAVRKIDDNIFQICAYGISDDMQYASQVMFPVDMGGPFPVTLGPIKGPPRPLSTSIHKIPADTEIKFPNGKQLFFAEDVFPNGHDHIVNVYSKSGNWTLSESESQSGYFDPIFKNAATGPIQGDLSVNFYINTGNLQSFFNITGLSDPTQFPPIDEEKITGYFGDFRFSDAYLNSLDFSISPNSISQASASFTVYGELDYDDSITSSYYSSNDYSQKSIAHGSTTKLLGIGGLGIDHPVGFNYSINVERIPRYSVPTGSSYDSAGLVPDRVAKSKTTVSMTVDGEGLDPNILSEGFGGKRANLRVELMDLSYQNFEDNSNGFMHAFACSGSIQSQSLSVNSAGYLNGSVSVVQQIK